MKHNEYLVTNNQFIDGQGSKYNLLKYKKLRSLLIPKKNYYLISMDFMTSIFNVEDNDAIMIVMIL